MVGVKKGFRSGLEDAIAKTLQDKGIEAEYETIEVKYEKPAQMHRYTIDFLLPNGIIIESKGRFTSDDRKKHLLIQEQHPELDIRFVFSNPNTRLYKGSPTTYAKWCEKHGFKYAKISIPQDWLDEPVNPRSKKNAERFRKNK